MKRWPSDPRSALRESLAIFDRVAPRYDLMRRLVSGGREDAWKDETLRAALPPGPLRALDLATGTGDIAAWILREHPGSHVVGLDAHGGMLARARAKYGTGIDWVCGDLNALPLGARAAFDIVTIGYGMRYVPHLAGLFRACHDLLAPAGTLWTFDLGRPRNGLWRAVWQAYLAVTGTALGIFLHARPSTYWHLLESLAAFPGQEAVAGMMREAGFPQVAVRERIGGVLAVHVARSPRTESPRE